MTAAQDCDIRCPGCSRVCCIDNGDLCGCDEYAWWVFEVKSGHEVTWVRWSWAKNRALQLASSPGEK